jgi:hypothetical protein
MYAALKNLALDLLLALHSFPSSRHLPSSDRRGTLIRDVGILLALLDDTNKFEVIYLELVAMNSMSLLKHTKDAI